MARRSRRTSLPPPFLKRVWLPSDTIDCGSAWKKDPVSGVIGAQKGPLISVV